MNLPKTLQNESFIQLMEKYKKLSPEEEKELHLKQYNDAVGDLNENGEYDCPICKNKGFIYIYGENSDEIKACQCKCMKIRKTLYDLKNSGLSGVCKKYTFENYKVKDPWQADIKKRALDFCKDTEAKAFYIGGQSGCVDADTEYFNGIQWKKISDYNGEQVLQYNPKTKEANLTKPKRYIKVPSEKLYKISTIRGSISQVISADHNFAYITSKGHMKKKPFYEVMKIHEENIQGFYGKIETTFSYNGIGIDLTDNEIRLMCAVIADGSFGNGKKYCDVNVKKDRKKERLRELLSSIDYKEYKKSNGYSLFRFCAPRREKVFTEYWYGCNKRQLEIIADEVFYWDGSIDNKNRHRFFTTKKESADFIQFALSATGKRATISIDNREGHTISYTVIATSGKSTVSMASTSGKTKAKITEYIPNDGKQYCFEVETGYLVLRRNGRIFITGNSGKTHICTAITLDFIKRGVSCKYMLWRDESVRLKAVINDAEEYNKAINELKSVDFLYIDDFLKTNQSVNPTIADINLAFEIVNYRFVNGKRTIFSSEFLIGDIIKIDEATGGRIFENAGKEYCISIAKSIAKNYRIS